ncbi:hypothetical protein HJD18_14170 [Thermoleophilia bacterium SCSIO 60948]|nr:hypothetical protein HJD18_14170 [Thermoleophilia bacterium SCSIO 60948]
MPLDRIQVDPTELHDRLRREFGIEVIDRAITDVVDYARESTDVSIRFIDDPASSRGSRHSVRGSSSRTD